MSDENMQTLIEAATPGPWEWEIGGGDTHVSLKTRFPHISGSGRIYHPRILSPSGFDADFIEVKSADAVLIAAASEWVPDTLDRLDRIRELHAPKEWPVVSGTITLCTVCHDSWPCETRRIIDEEGDNHE